MTGIRTHILPHMDDGSGSLLLQGISQSQSEGLASLRMEGTELLLLAMTLSAQVGRSSASIR